MRAILIPVKDFSAAKTRLAPHLSQEARIALAAALCEDVFAALAEAACAERIFVVSSEQRALDMARVRGWETIEETEQISESASVDAAARRCAARGVAALLRLPADIPLLEPGDVAPLFDAAGPAPFAVVVSSRDGTGTNALLRSPPGLFPSHFGPGSFEKHLAEAARCGAETRVLENERIGFDIDALADLKDLRGRARPKSATARWLDRYGANLD